jgi:hypothetical protein
LPAYRDVIRADNGNDRLEGGGGADSAPPARARRRVLNSKSAAAINAALASPGKS